MSDNGRSGKVVVLLIIGILVGVSVGYGFSFLYQPVTSELRGEIESLKAVGASTVTETLTISGAAPPPETLTTTIVQTSTITQTRTQTVTTAGSDQPSVIGSLGSKSDITAGLNEKLSEFGVVLVNETFSPLEGGKPRYFIAASNGLGLFELIGEGESIEKVSLIVHASPEPEEALAALFLMLSFLDVMVPDWEDPGSWIVDVIERQAETDSIVVGDRQISILTSRELGFILIAVEAVS